MDLRSKIGMGYTRCCYLRIYLPFFDVFTCNKMLRSSYNLDIHHPQHRQHAHHGHILHPLSEGSHHPRFHLPQHLKIRFRLPPYSRYLPHHHCGSYDSLGYLSEFKNKYGSKCRQIRFHLHLLKLFPLSPAYRRSYHCNYSSCWISSGCYFSLFDRLVLFPK